MAANDTQSPFLEARSFLSDVTEEDDEQADGVRLDIRKTPFW